MLGREWGALFLVLLTACAGSPRGVATSTDSYEAELEAIRYEMHVLTAGAVDTEPVEVEEEDLQEAMPVVARHVRASDRPRETVRWLLEEELQADLLAEVEYGRQASAKTGSEPCSKAMPISSIKRSPRPNSSRQSSLSLAYGP
jgi:hypothetical protein